MSIQLLYGDCLELMRDIPDGCVDAIIADLPYGQTQNIWDNPIPFEPLWKHYERIIKDNGAIILFGQGAFAAKVITSNEKLFRYDIVYEKTQPSGHLNANKMPMRCHEQMLVFYKKLPTYNPQKTAGHPRKISTASHKRNCKKSNNYNDYEFTSYDSTERYPRSVWKFAKDTQKEKDNETQKPLALMEELVKTYTNEGDLVLDNCMGSGTTGVACYNLNRSFIGMEINIDSYVKADARIQAVMSAA